jgi:hypothetical protein
LHVARVGDAADQPYGLYDPRDGVLEVVRVDRVEQVEYFGNGFDAGVPAEVKRARDAQVQLRECRAATAVDRGAGADVLERRDAARVEAGEGDGTLWQVVQFAVVVQVDPFAEVDRQRRAVEEDRRDAERPRQLQRRTRRHPVPRVGATVRTEHARIVERVGRILHVACVELIARRANRARAGRQRIGACEIDAARQPATDTEDESVVLRPAAADRRACRRGVRAERDVGEAARRRRFGVEARTHVQVAAVDVDVVGGHDGAARHLVRPAERRLIGLGLLEPRIDPLAEERERARLVLRREVGQRLADLIKAAVGIAQPARVGRAEHRAKPRSTCIGGGEQDVRVGIAEVGVDAPAGAHEIPGIAAHIPDRAEPRLDVVGVVFRRQAEVLVADDVGEAAGGPELLGKHVIGVLRLIELQAFDQIVADAEVDGQPIAGAPVVLHVGGVLLEGMFAAESPSFSCTFETGPFTSLVRCVYWMTPLPVLKVMKRRGSLMKLPPALRSWPRPPLPATCHEKSSRNWYFFWAVDCGVLMFWPTVTPLGKD